MSEVSYCHEVQEIEIVAIKSGSAGLEKISSFFGAVATGYCEHVSREGIREIRGAEADFLELIKMQKADPNDPEALAEVEAAKKFPTMIPSNSETEKQKQKSKNAWWWCR